MIQAARTIESVLRQNESELALLGSPAPEESALPKPRTRRPWKPSGRDEVIYNWVRFEGKSQEWVAEAYGINQATVSRILQRYEKWRAHAQPGADGSLSRAERQRMQWWLTYERNERILSSSMRMAHDMEFPRDVSKSVIQRPQSHLTEETEIRTEHSVLDRSGMAARFLRLAFRINMEQMKLVDREPEPLPPLLEDDQDFDGMADAEEEGEGDVQLRVASGEDTASEVVRRQTTADGSAAASGTLELEQTIEVEQEDEAREVESDKTPTLKLHNLHSRDAQKNDGSLAGDKTCAQLNAEKTTCEPFVPSDAIGWEGEDGGGARSDGRTRHPR